VIGASRPAPAGNTLAAVNDYTTYSSTRSAYRDLLIASPLIADAMGYSSLSGNIRSHIWTAIEAIASTGIPGDPATPADYPVDPFDGTAAQKSSITLTTAEIEDIYSAWVAHALWLDMSGKVPWRLSTYSLAELETIFDIDNVAPTIGYAWVCAHSPLEAYTQVQDAITLPFTATEKDAIDQIIEGEMRDFAHSVGGHATEPLHCVTIADARAAGEPPTGNQKSYGKFIARQGCNFWGRYNSPIGRALNIPTETLLGYYYGAGHVSTAWRRAGFVFPHGDDSGRAVSSAQIGTQLCDSYADWVANIFPAGANSGDAVPTLQRNWLKRMHWIAYPDLNAFSNPAQGWPYINGQLDPYFDAGDDALVAAYKVALEDRTLSDGAGPPDPNNGDLEIDCTGFEGSGWSVTPDPFTGVVGSSYQGSGSITLDVPSGMLPEDYLLGWIDTIDGYHLTSWLEGPTTLNTASSITFGPPPYVAD